METDNTSKLSKAQQKAIREGKVVETINALNHLDFADRFCNRTSIEEVERRLADRTGKEFEVVLAFGQTLGYHEKDVLEACFQLIEESSAADYKTSEMKWSPSNKRKEMVLPDMRYFLIKEYGAETQKPRVALHEPLIAGFISYMITYEDGHEVIYVYEIHLAPEGRGQGVGKVLMDMVESIGRQATVEKCMLTVFKSNKHAVRWYERIGYAIDEYSPGPRVLRNGSIKEPSYLILSKPLSDITGAASTATTR